MKYRKYFLFLILSFGIIGARGENQRPRLLLTQEGVRMIKEQLGSNPILDVSFGKIKEAADFALKNEIIVPEPLDVASYTHEKHKANYNDMYNAGVMYQITGEKKYAEFVKNMLFKYAEMYPRLDYHPAAYTVTPGRIFYQILNEAVWLTFTANAYDCIYTYLTPGQRKTIEDNIFRPMVKTFTHGVAGNYKAFNSMHNFGTWMTAGVGMIGFVMDEKEYVEMALKGSEKDGKDGFLKQLDELFSPDGYYDEGPGYQRYAIFPFITFAECINNNMPELKIFEYRNKILPKAVNTLLNCAYEGDIFLMNDSHEKNYFTYEILFSTNIAYKNNSSDKGMLDIIRQQKVITLTDGGIMAAIDIKANQSRNFDFTSQAINSGKDGGLGALSIMRGGDNTCLALKATTHGGGHGHFDRLSLIYFSNGSNIFPDYGSARFINIEAKAKGGYSVENDSFAKLSIAHNTISVDQTCHYGGNLKESLKHGCIINFSDYSNKNFQVFSANDNNAYLGVNMKRTVALVTAEDYQYPLVLDVIKLQSDEEHQYDMPFYYNGHLMSVSFPYTRFTTMLQPLGEKNGYQHLWKDAVSNRDSIFNQLTFLKEDRFYTISSASTGKVTPYLITIGANDPDYMLVNRPGFLYRTKSKNQTFVNIVEPHGKYDLVRETTRNDLSSVKNVEILSDDDSFTAIRVTNVSGSSLTIILANKDFNPEVTRTVVISGNKYTFKGNYYIEKE